MSIANSTYRNIIRAQEDRQWEARRDANPDRVDVHPGTGGPHGNLATMSFGHGDVGNGAIHITFENGGSVSIQHILKERWSGATVISSVYNTSIGHQLTRSDHHQGEELENRQNTAAKERLVARQGRELTPKELMQRALPNEENLDVAFKRISNYALASEQIELARLAVDQVKNGTFEIIPKSLSIDMSL